MSVDPSSLVVIAATAVNAAVLGVDLPDEAIEHIGAAASSVEHFVAQVGTGIDDVIAALPRDVQEPARDAVADAVERIAAETAAHLPGAASSTTEIGTENAPGAEVDDAPVLAGPAGRSNPQGASMPNVSGGVLLPQVPAIVPGSALAPIGALAVFAPWLKKAGEVCDGITAPVLAALYSAENGFRYGPTAPVSPAGARGPGQFMPGTWAKYGKDADGDGDVNVLAIADSVMASGDLLCDSWSQVEQWKRDGRVEGDTLALTVAAYNAGLGAVLRYGGMPAGLPDYENQTKPYVAKILAARPVFERMLSPLLALKFPTGDTAAKVIDAAFRYLGLPYVWGGGDIHGPSGGGFDCSGLTSFAVHKAAGVALPRTSETQWQVGVEVSMSEALPGDLVFGNWQAGGPGHVGIYIGGGQMVHAPTTGDVVRVGDVFSDMRARRIL